VESGAKAAVDALRQMGLSKEDALSLVARLWD
jgi:hypothetical protein